MLGDGLALLHLVGTVSETTPRERPILFGAESVRAILAGKKTQTRRVVRGCALRWLEDDGFTPGFVALADNGLSPYGYAGDRLWVRETFAVNPHAAGVGYPYFYRAETPYMPTDGPWTSPLFMPRSASRLLLNVVAVRVERLQEISDEDAYAEGWKTLFGKGLFYRAFDSAWDAINEKRGYSWESNPWVWVVSFKVATEEPCMPAAERETHERIAQAGHEGLRSSWAEGETGK